MSKPQEHLRFSVIIPTMNRVHQLQECCESLLRQDIDPAAFEIIVVDDGSTDRTSAYLHSLPPDGCIRSLEIQNIGPARARNRGAAIVWGEILVFTDDDCRHPQSWLRDLERVMTENQAVAAGGAVSNRVTGNVLAQVYETMNRYMSGRINEEAGKARFLTTNNFAILRSVFEQYGGFDERFFTGAEDRELTSRLVASGETVWYAPEIVIDHYHQFSLRSFLFLLYRQGRGSFLYYNVIGREKQLEVRPLPLRDYVQLIRVASDGRTIPERLQRFVVALLAQCFVFLGYLSAQWEGITDLRAERSEQPAAATSGARGTMLGLMTFLGGSAFSSSFGFLSFLVIGKALSIPHFGIFMVAFSLESILNSLAGLGLSSSVSRFASEFSKRGDEENAASILKTGLLMQAAFMSAFLLAALFLSNVILNSLFNVRIPIELYGVVLAGALGSVLSNYLTSVFGIYLRFLDSTLLQSTVSLTRFGSIVVLALAGLGSPVTFYAAFTLPNWIGLTVGAVAFSRSVRGKGTVQRSLVRRILSYGGWQTLTSVSRLLTTHFGALLLAAFTSEHDVGTYGLGLTLSFVFGVIATTINSYFTPIGARVKKNEDILPFVQRTLRLVLPIVLFSLMALLLAAPFVELVYGPSKLSAVPVLALLSLPTVIGMVFVSNSVLFQYFFKPYYITLESVLRAVLFLSGAFILRPSGATGMAAIYCISSLLGQGISLGILLHELKKAGVGFDLHLWRTFGFSAVVRPGQENDPR